MAIHLYWDDDELTTLLCVFDGRWSWDELFATLKTIQQITGDLDHEVAAIIDVRKGVSLPGSLFTPQTLDQAKRLLGMSDTNAGPMLIVGVNPVIRMIVDAVAKIDCHAVARVRFMESVSQAREFLKTRRTA
ncbi:MAG TPA: hypothetical protein VHL11_25280 [Phototrophicaceae bacterium]|jgi:hypothetical protein|nr:hypothetical protein [Phototrophicaceae bacterium]